MRGLAATMFAISLVIILLSFLYIDISSKTNDKNKMILINFREGEITKLESTYSFLNRALGMTWYISTAQSVFNVTDQSLLCGTDDAELIGNDAMPPKYWYRYDKNNGAKRINSVEVFVANPHGNSNKYNGDEPRVCYPQNDVALAQLERSFEEFKGVNEDFSVNGVSGKVVNVDAVFTFNENGVNTIAKQDVDLKSVNGAITESSVLVNQIYTEFPNMLEFSRFLVQKLAILSDSFYPNDIDSGLSYDFSLKYRDLNSPQGDVSYKAYLERISGVINSEVLNAERSSFDQAKATIDYNKLELFVPHERGDENIFIAPEGFNGGLALHYDMTVTINEGGVIGGKCEFPPPNNYQSIIESAVNEHEWKFGEFEFINTEIFSFVSSIYQQESNWNTRAVSECGAAGLGQLMPGTASDQDLSPIFEDARFVSCGGDATSYADRLKAAIQGVPDEDLGFVDARLDPQKSIPASINYIHHLFDQMKNYPADKTEFLNLVAASYNTGPGNVRSAISRANNQNDIDTSNVRFDDIRAFLAVQTQTYVLRVSGFYVCYGGSLPFAGSFYYYHDENDNRFFKKPISMEIKAEDYLPSIDCGDVEDVAIRFFGWEKSPKAISGFNYGDLACCGGELWSCESEVPGMPENRKLSNGGIASGTCANVLGQANLVCRSDGFELSGQA